MGNAAKISPFAPKGLPNVPVIDGVRFATVEAGIRYKNRTDLMLCLLDPGTVAAGVLTQSKTSSAPVLWCREGLSAGGKARAIVVNSGNSNAFTGAKGRETVRVTVEAAAKVADCTPHEVYVASTGVIGEPFDGGKIAAQLPALAKAVKPDMFAPAARAIMTTDTYPKLVTRTVKIGGVDVHLNGFCKGAGMIAPDMATMLCFLFTDAAIAQPVLQRLIAQHAKTTFNCMSVDSDTSTSDTCLLFATGAAAKRGQPVIADIADPRLAAFDAALHDLLRDLAIQVAKDGEGASKFVTIEISGAETWEAARRIGLSVANSPLLKTALSASDPNWGRVVMAVGKAGEAADRDRISIYFGEHCIARNGERAAEYVEATVAKYMEQPELVMRIDVGVGAAKATVWTCDLTHDYVSINADYRS